MVAKQQRASSIIILAKGAQVPGEGKEMPTYEYRCMKCEKVFPTHMSMAEHDQGKAKCPTCKGDAVIQQYSTFFAKTSKKS